MNYMENEKKPSKEDVQVCKEDVQVCKEDVQVCKEDSKREDIGEKENSEKGNLPNREMREIIIHTDGNGVFLKKADCPGNLELIAILNTLLGMLTNRH